MGGKLRGCQAFAPPTPCDVSDDAWAFVMPYLALLADDVSQRKYPLRDVVNGLR
jgi:hypothetical protein